MGVFAGGGFAVALALLGQVLAPVAPVASSTTPAVIVFGGGWDASSTVAAIELHAAELLRILDTQRRAPRVLFADGDARSLTVLDSSGDDSIAPSVLRAPKALARIDGPASAAALISSLEASAEASGGTIVFGVGHATAGGDRGDLALMLWGARDDAGPGPLTIAALVEELDTKPRRGPTAFVLGQCYSGGFTDLMYVAATSGEELARPARCVLAAQSAGCGTDPGERSARYAYAWLIAQALGGGAALGFDLDGDGRVSLAEAHAHARISDPTTNVPVSSSEAWVRSAAADDLPRVDRVRVGELLEIAGAVEKAVLTGLAPPWVQPKQTTVGEVVEKLEVLLDKVETMRSYQRATLERKAARIERYLRALEVVFLEEQLHKRKRRRALRVLAEIRACEGLVP